MKIFLNAKGKTGGGMVKEEREGRVRRGPPGVYLHFY